MVILMKCMFGGVFGANSQSQWCFCTGLGYLDVYCRRENVSPESWPYFWVTGIQNDSTSGTSKWSQRVKVKDTRHLDVLKHLEDAFIVHFSSGYFTSSRQGSRQHRSRRIGQWRNCPFPLLQLISFILDMGSCHLFAIYLLINLKCLTWRRHHKWQVVLLGAASNAGMHFSKGIIQVKSRFNSRALCRETGLCWGGG